MEEFRSSKRLPEEIIPIKIVGLVEVQNGLLFKRELAKHPRSTCDSNPLGHRGQDPKTAFGLM